MNHKSFALSLFFVLIVLSNSREIVNTNFNNGGNIVNNNDLFADTGSIRNTNLLANGGIIQNDNANFSGKNIDNTSVNLKGAAIRNINQTGQPSDVGLTNVVVPPTTTITNLTSTPRASNLRATLIPGGAVINNNLGVPGMARVITNNNNVAPGTNIINNNNIPVVRILP
jgi:hypothetical protein